MNKCLREDWTLYNLGTRHYRLSGFFNIRPYNPASKCLGLGITTDFQKQSHKIK